MYDVYFVVYIVYTKRIYYKQTNKQTNTKYKTTHTTQSTNKIKSNK